MDGLLKAYVKVPVGAKIDSHYANRPKRIGVTIAYGSDISEEALNLVGSIVSFRTEWIVSGDKTAFVTCELIVSESSDRVINIRRDRLVIPTPFHLTLGWVIGASPVLSGYECAAFWSSMADRECLPPSVQFESIVSGTIEFQSFEVKT